MRGRTKSNVWKKEAIQISIHALMRGRTRYQRIRGIERRFQFTPSCEGEPDPVGDAAGTNEFQFTPSCEGEQMVQRCGTTVTRFQFTPSCEGERRIPYKWVSIHKFQFTPSCEGEHILAAVKEAYLRISIHALMRGRTNMRKDVWAD